MPDRQTGVDREGSPIYEHYKKKSSSARGKRRRKKGRRTRKALEILGKNKK